MDKKSEKEDLQNRLNQIKNKSISKESTIIINNNESLKDNKSLEFNLLKDKVKMDNAPEMKEVKDLAKNIKTIKQGFSSVSSSNTIITKEKFLNLTTKRKKKFNIF